MEPFRPTYAEIDLRNLGHNIAQIRKFVSSNTKVMGVVKANAYGHGAVDISRSCEKSGVDYLGVASLGEALEIRSASVKTPILILSETPIAYLERIIDADLTQTVYTYELAQFLSDIAKQKGATAKIHIKVDTGMGRVGVLYDEALPLIKKILSLPNLYLEGIFTHFAKAEDSKSDFTVSQYKKFMELFGLLSKEGINIPIKHAANSAAMINYPFTHLDMVRVGICLYGLYPFRSVPSSKNLSLKKVLSFKTKILYLKKAPKGTTISYGSSYAAPKDTKIATLPVGYADGLSRGLSNNGQVIIRGRRYPIVGNVTMDMTMIDTDDEQEIEAGDDVVIIGKQKEEEITADDIAKILGTINYEVICGIGKRVPRVYLR